MKSVISMLVMGALLALHFVGVAYAHGKPLPPAFGKELVPDEATQERNEDKAAELEEEKATTVKKPRAAARAPHEMRGKKLHIELDGDEDGGGIDDDLDDGGEF